MRAQAYASRALLPYADSSSWPEEVLASRELLRSPFVDPALSNSLPRLPVSGAKPDRATHLQSTSGFSVQPLIASIVFRAPTSHCRSQPDPSKARIGPRHSYIYPGSQDLLSRAPLVEIPSVTCADSKFRTDSMGMQWKAVRWLQLRRPSCRTTPLLPPLQAKLCHSRSGAAWNGLRRDRSIAWQSPCFLKTFPAPYRLVMQHTVKRCIVSHPNLEVATGRI